MTVGQLKKQLEQFNDDKIIKFNLDGSIYQYMDWLLNISSDNYDVNMKAHKKYVEIKLSYY